MSPAKDSQWVCKWCNALFVSRNKLRKHRRDHEHFCTCDKCGVVFRSETFLVEPTCVGKDELSPNEVTSGSENEEFSERLTQNWQCNRCQMAINTQALLCRHACAKQTVSKYLCPKCGKRFDTNKGHEIHVSYCETMNTVLLIYSLTSILKEEYKL